MKLKLLQPIKPFAIIQPFGVNGEYYQEHGINIKGHNGLDLHATHGQPVYAAHDGFAYYEWDSSQGEGVVIRSKEQAEVDGVLTYYKTIYWHMVDSVKEPKYKSPITCLDWNSKGQEVKAGDLIGYADSTGFSTGDHLHFGLKPISTGETLGGVTNPNQNNGYGGAINPAPYIVYPNFVFEKDLSYGMTDPDVVQLQQRLRLPVELWTGYFGLRTALTLALFQLGNGIKPVGVRYGKLDENTRRVINA